MGIFEAKVTAKGQITLPSKMRDVLRIDAGHRVVFRERPDGSFTIEAKTGSLTDLKGIIRGKGLISGGDIKRWIDEARASGMPPGLKNRLKRPHR